MGFPNSAPWALGRGAPSGPAVPTSKHTGATPGRAASDPGLAQPWRGGGQPALVLGVQRPCQGLCPLAGRPSAFWMGGCGRGVWRGTLNFHCPAACPHPSPQPCAISGRPDPPAALEGRARGVLTFPAAPASWGLSNVLETSVSRPDACGRGYTLRLCFWSVLGSGSASTSCVALGKSLQCSKLRFLRW